MSSTPLRKSRGPVSIKEDDDDEGVDYSEPRPPAVEVRSGGEPSAVIQTATHQGWVTMTSSHVTHVCHLCCQ